MNSLLSKSADLVAMAALVALLAAAAAPRGALAAKDVCYTGFIMDKYCIDRGTLLDNPSVISLENPELHSLHCLVDPPFCQPPATTYEMLVANPNSTGPAYCRAYTLGIEGSEQMLDFARAAGRKGSCTSCLNESSVAPSHGLRATVFGTIEAGGNPPLLTITRIAPESVGCGPDGPTVPLAAELNCDYGGDLPWIRWHGSLMMVSWGFLLPLGVIGARFLRHRPDSLWFKLHRALQSFGLVLAIAGWSIALHRFDVFASGKLTTQALHGGLGIATMSLGIAQPLNAFVRPHPPSPGEKKSTSRLLWERVHKTSGYVAVAAGLITVALGVHVAAQPEFGPAFLAAIIVLFAAAALAVADGRAFAKAAAAQAAAGRKDVENPVAVAMKKVHAPEPEAEPSDTN